MVLAVVGALLVVTPWVVARRSPGVPGGAARVAVERAAPRVDPVLLLELVDAAVASGASLPRALRAVGAAAGGAAGRAVDAAGAALVLGASWAAAWADAPPEVHDVRDCLEQAWANGAAPGPAARARAAAVRRDRRRRARTAGASLGVHLVLPLGLCFLPAFALLGLVPLVMGLGAGLLDGVLP